MDGWKGEAYMDTVGIALWSIYGLLLIEGLFEMRRAGDPDLRGASRAVSLRAPKARRTRLRRLV
jgi:hypothetical protein